MEKIQSAIEKARAARDVNLANSTSAPLTSAPALEVVHSSATANQRPDTASETASAIAAAWAALPLFEPKSANLRNSRIVTLAGGAESVPFDVLRTKVVHQMRANGWRRLAITSPRPGCGKSTIALNLAFGLARQREMHVILAELDLRRPSLRSMLGVGPRLGIAQLLDGRAGFADVAQRHGEGLALALSDGPVRNPAELLHSRRIAEILAEIELRYAPDIMIFDIPPLLVSDDAMAFMGNVDAVLLIAGAESTTVKEIDSCERELAAQTNVMGVVLNKCRYMAEEYGYDYYG